MNKLSIPIQELNYAQQLSIFECECILDQRRFFQPSQQARIAEIFDLQIHVDREAFAHLKLTIFSKKTAITLSIDYLSNLALKIKELYKLRNNEDLDIALLEQMIENPRFRNICPESCEDIGEMVSSKNFKKIIFYPAKTIFAQYCKEYNIEPLKRKSISSELSTRNKIKNYFCIQYALYKITGELDTMPTPIKKVIKINSEESGSYSSNYLMLYLACGFTPVVHPRERDLILYINKEKNVNHVGIFHDSTRVESKWGKLSIFRHSVEDVNFGNSYVIIRPPEK